MQQVPRRIADGGEKLEAPRSDGAAGRDEACGDGADGYDEMLGKGCLGEGNAYREFPLKVAVSSQKFASSYAGGPVQKINPAEAAAQGAEVEGGIGEKAADEAAVNCFRGEGKGCQTSSTIIAGPAQKLEAEEVGGGKSVKGCGSGVALVACG